MSKTLLTPGSLTSPFGDEDKLRALLEGIPQQVWTALPDGQLNYVNGRVTDYFGRSYDAMLGAGWTGIVHQDDLPDTIARWLHSLTTGEHYENNFRLLRADGTYRWHLAMATPLRDPQGNITLWIGTNTDISQHKDIEDALAISEANLAAAQARAKMGSWRHELATKTDTWSTEMYRLFGWDPATKPPSFLTFLHLVHPDDRTAFLGHYHHYIRESGLHQLDFRVPQPNGDLLWIEARSEILRDDNGNPVTLTGTAQDITDRKKAELAFNASESRFRAFMEKSPALGFIKDEKGIFVYINATFERAFQTRPEDIIGKTVYDFLPEDVAYRVDQYDQSIFAANRHVEGIEHVPTPDGMRHWMSVKFVFSNAEGHRFLGCTAFDLTDYHNAEQALRTSTQLLNASQAVARLGGWELDLLNGKVFWTEQVYYLLDTTPQHHSPTLDSGLGRFDLASRQLVSDAISHASITGEGFDMELEMATFQGRNIDVRLTCTASLRDGIPVKLTGIIQDISEQKAVQRNLEAVNQELARANSVLEHVAHYDALTNLPNRVLLADRMQQAMLHNQRHGKFLAVAFLDLDGFKAINDQHGHNIGDELLISLAQRLRVVLREGDTLARIGGDEFAIVMTDLTQTAECEPLLRRLLSTCAEPILLRDYQLQVTGSIGVTIYPQDDVDAEQLLRHADQAMYLAKQAGKNCYHLFDVAKEAAVKSQHASLEHIRAALYNEEFVLYYQPKVNMRTGEVIGVEALIRWQHPQRGLLPPGVFLPAIENHVLSVEMGEWVINTALKQMSLWRKLGLELPISVNIGALQLQRSDFPKRLKQLLSAHAHPKNLELEILETSALEDIAQVSSIINDCQQLGVSFALDDFGTGYSSLAYLKRLPAELLKIDQSFVRDMLDDQDDLAIIKGIIGLATAFRRQVIAEGVETIAHGEMLLRIGCELAQGYGIARPMPAGAVPDWVKTWQPDVAWRQH